MRPSSSTKRTRKWSRRSGWKILRQRDHPQARAAIALVVAFAVGERDRARAVLAGKLREPGGPNLYRFGLRVERRDVPHARLDLVPVLTGDRDINEWGQIIAGVGPTNGPPIPSLVRLTPFIDWSEGGPSSASRGTPPKIDPSVYKRWMRFPQALDRR